MEIFDGSLQFCEPYDISNAMKSFFDKKNDSLIWADFDIFLKGGFSIVGEFQTIIDFSKSFVGSDIMSQEKANKSR